VPARPSRVPTAPVPPGLRRYARGQGPREREPPRLGPPPALAPPGTARHHSPGPQDRSDRPENHPAVRSSAVASDAHTDGRWRSLATRLCPRAALFFFKQKTAYEIET